MRKENLKERLRSRQMVNMTDRLCTQVHRAPARKKLIQKTELLQAQFDVAEAAAEDFVLIGTLGMQLQELERQSAQLPLSEEDYLTLADRHAALVQQVTDRCRDLKAARNFGQLKVLAEQLLELTALDVSNLPRASVGKCFTALMHLFSSHAYCLNPPAPLLVFRRSGSPRSEQSDP
jgi:hypothetical protein